MQCEIIDLADEWFAWCLVFVGRTSERRWNAEANTFRVSDGNCFVFVGRKKIWLAPTDQVGSECICIMLRSSR